MKPILIDALHIHMGGALMILNHLIDRLTSRNVDVVLLKDERCPELRSEYLIRKIHIMSCGEFERKRFYKSCRSDFSGVLCLGNIPPSIKLETFVATYIHNVSLFQVPRDYSISWKIKSILKRLYINYQSPNTDVWIVQTDNTQNIIRKYLNTHKPILIYPFFYIPASINTPLSDTRRDYIFVGEHTYAKGHEYLIEAWVKLSKLQLDYTPKLHLTVASPSLLPLIKDAVASGANIENHGRIPFDDVVNLYKYSKATIYPSLNESLGLGIIEAAEAGCDVIGCDLPYMHSVCEPSETFKPCDSDSILAAVLKYELKNSSKTKLKIKDEVESLIDYMLQNRRP